MFSVTKVATGNYVTLDHRRLSRRVHHRAMRLMQQRMKLAGNSWNKSSAMRGTFQCVFPTTLLNRHTTMSYRAPEMLDLYSGKLINEKVDVWVGDGIYRFCPP